MDKCFEKRILDGLVYFCCISEVVIRDSSRPALLQGDDIAELFSCSLPSTPSQ
jgi:hypothetical protein